MASQWTTQQIMEAVRGYQGACVIMAGAEVNVFAALADGPADGSALAKKLGADPRALAVLLDALAALGLIDKAGDKYSASPEAIKLLAQVGPGSILAGVRHHANCIRRWAQLAEVVKNGRSAERAASVLGGQADLESFINAMHEFSYPVAQGLIGELVERLGADSFTHVLDVGGGPGTWTMAFLRANPGCRATLFDMPEVVPIARGWIAKAGLADRVQFVAGNFTKDPLPSGADLAWVSAIIHQNSRQQNRDLFAKVHAALAGGGRIVVRDIVMDPSRVTPADGALFAINMLVATEGGGTFTLDEIRQDLESAGFSRVELLRKGEGMDSLVVARK